MSMNHQPDHRRIQPGILQGEMTAPPSKSVSHRLLIMGALSEKECTISEVLLSDDIQITLDALRKMGFNWIRKSNQIHFTGRRETPEGLSRIFLGNSGTTARLLTAVAVTLPGQYILYGTPRLEERPMKPLLDALQKLGAEIRHHNGFLPVEISGKSIRGAPVEIDASLSSQYISGLMLMAPLTENGLEIVPIGDGVSVPYIHLTASLMKEAGISLTTGEQRIGIPGSQKYNLKAAGVEGDYSSISSFAVGAGISGGDVMIKNLNRYSCQGDRMIFTLLEQAGARVEWRDTVVRVSAEKLSGIDVNMRDYPDIVPSAAIMALFASGSSRFRQVEHLRHKETDRLRALAENISRLNGNAVIEGTDLIISPAELKGALLPTYNDHRMAMSFALVGLKIPEVSIMDPGCVEKSFPEFWTIFDRLNQIER